MADKKAHQGRPITRDRDTWLAYRVRYLPKAIERAERKLSALRREAREYGFYDLIDGESNDTRRKSNSGAA